MNTQPASTTRLLAVFALMVALGAASRFLNLAPNFAAVAAVALFAGWYFQNRLLAIAAPIAAMLISDAFIGGYDWRLMLATYAALVLPTLLGRFLPERLNLARILTASLAASILFFTLSNFAVWIFSADVAYPKTAAGLAACFSSAIPFFRYTLAGDLIFSLAFFGAHEVVTRAADRRAARALRTA